MATLRDSQFGLEVTNVPAINIRLEFNQLLALFRKDRFRDQFSRAGKPNPIATPYFVWHGRPAVLLSHLLRESIVGLESAVSAAVLMEALERGVATRAVLEATKNPMSRGRGTAHCVYNLLPAIIDASYALKTHDEQLWKRTCTFYKEVRNPLFHAYEISQKDPDPVWRMLEFMWEIYGWINWWQPIDRLMSAAPIQWASGMIERASSIIDISDEVIENLLAHAKT
jgi:hypothetical protein